MIFKNLIRKYTKPTAKPNPYRFHTGTDVEFIAPTNYPNIWLKMEQFDSTVLWTEFDELVHQELSLMSKRFKSNADHLRLLVCCLGIPSKNQETLAPFKNYHFKAYEQIEYGGGALEHHDPSCPLDRITAAAVCAAQSRELLKQNYTKSINHQKNAKLRVERKLGYIHDNTHAQKVSSFAMDISKYVSMILPRESKLEFNHLTPKDTIINPELYVFSIKTITDFDGIRQASKIDMFVLFESPNFVMPDIGSREFLQILIHPKKAADFYQLQMIRQVFNYMKLNDIFVGILSNEDHVRFIAKLNQDDSSPDGRHGGSLWVSRAFPKLSLFSNMNSRITSVFGYISAIVNIILRSKDMAIDWPGKGIHVFAESSKELFETELQRLNEEPLYAEKFNDLENYTTDNHVDIYKFNQHLIDLEFFGETADSVDKTYNKWKLEKLFDQEKMTKYEHEGTRKDNENELDEQLLSDICSYYSNSSKDFHKWIEPGDNHLSDIKELPNDVTLVHKSDDEDSGNDVYFYDEDSNQVISYTSQESIDESNEANTVDTKELNFGTRNLSFTHISGNTTGQVPSISSKNCSLKFFTRTPTSVSYKYFTKNGKNTGILVNPNFTYLSNRGIQTYNQLCTYSNYNVQGPAYDTKVFKRMLRHEDFFRHGLTSCDRMTKVELFNMNNRQHDFCIPRLRGSFELIPELAIHEEIKQIHKTGYKFVVLVSRTNDSAWFAVCKNQEHLRDHEYTSGTLKISHFDSQNDTVVSKECAVLIKNIHYKYKLESCSNRRLKAAYNEVMIHRYIKEQDSKCNIVPQVYVFGDVWKTCKMLLVKPWGRKLHIEDLEDDTKEQVANKMRHALNRLHNLNIALNFISLDAFGIDPKGNVLIIDLRKAYIVKPLDMDLVIQSETDYLEALIINASKFSGHTQLSVDPDMYTKSMDLETEPDAVESIPSHPATPRTRLKTGRPDIYKVCKAVKIEKKPTKLRRLMTIISKSQS